MAGDELKERQRFRLRRHGDIDMEWCNQGGGMEEARDGHPISAFHRPGGGEPSRWGGRQMVVGDSINASVTQIRRGIVEGEGLGEEGDNFPKLYQNHLDAIPYHNHNHTKTIP
jgi:hypothetical protein